MAADPLTPSEPRLPTSPRLYFRTWTLADHDLAVSLWADPEVSRYLGGPMSHDTISARLRLEMDRQETLGLQYWPVFSSDTGAFAGCAGLRPFHDEAHVYEMGVHIARAFWSQRLGEEAARAVIHHAFQTRRAFALTAGHHPENLHSKAMIERLGFHYTHREPWGPLDILHPFYRLDRPA